MCMYSFHVIYTVEELILSNLPYFIRFQKLGFLLSMKRPLSITQIKWRMKRLAIILFCCKDCNTEVSGSLFCC